MTAIRKIEINGEAICTRVDKTLYFHTGYKLGLFATLEFFFISRDIEVPVLLFVAISSHPRVMKRKWPYQIFPRFFTPEARDTSMSVRRKKEILAWLLLIINELSRRTLQWRLYLSLRVNVVTRARSVTYPVHRCRAGKSEIFLS